MPTIRILSTALLLALCLATPSYASDDLPDVTEAFRYVVTDTGDALEIDWSIAECCYLYRNKLEFESGVKDPRKQQETLFPYEHLDMSIDHLLVSLDGVKLDAENWIQAQHEPDA